MGRKAKAQQPQERNVLVIALRDVSDVVLSLPKIGRFCIAEIPSCLSHQFYEALLQRCPKDLQETLREDDAIHLDEKESWWYILNEMLSAGVQLPIAGDMPDVPDYEPAEQPCETGPVALVIDGYEWKAYLQMKNCGKQGCKKCRVGKGHGPYWLAYRYDGKHHRKYLGKTLPDVK